MNINSYYTRPWILKRYLKGPLAPHLTPFSKFLAKKGYSYATGQRYVREIGHMSRWLDNQGIGIADLNERTIRTYLSFRYSSTHLSIKCGPYRQLLEYLQQNGTISIQEPEETPLSQCITNYQQHMVQNEGLVYETIRLRIRVARNFLSFRFGQNSLDLQHLLPSHVEQYFLNRSHRCNAATLKNEASALRCFLRFLQFRGEILMWFN